MDRLIKLVQAAGAAAATALVTGPRPAVSQIKVPVASAAGAAPQGRPRNPRKLTGATYYEVVAFFPPGVKSISAPAAYTVPPPARTVPVRKPPVAATHQ